MTKQGEIREWLENELDIYAGFKYSKQETAQDILSYLCSKGVAIKVERELPETTLCDCGHPKTAHYHTEPLIEEATSDSPLGTGKVDVVAQYLLDEVCSNYEYDWGSALEGDKDAFRAYSIEIIKILNRRVRQ